jgi:hypothetical protein
MASQVLGGSPSNGLTVSINYNASTLHSTGFSVVLAQPLHDHVTITLNLNGQPQTFTYNANLAAGTYNVPYVTTGTSRVDRHGETIIDWSFAPFKITISPP